MATKLDLADAQFIGFGMRRTGTSAVELVESMGLTKKEWIEWNKKYTTSYLTPDELAEIDEHFGVTVKIVD